MVAYCDSASNIREEIYRTILLTFASGYLEKCAKSCQNTIQITRSFRSKLILIWKNGMEYERKF